MFRIVIVGWKAEQYVERCLNSVIHQSVQDWTACVVLDPSDDRTVEIAQAVAAKDPRFKIVANDKQMFSIPNIIRSITEQRPENNDVIVIIDADDWLTNNESLNTVKMCYDNNPDLMVTHGSWVSYPEPNIVTNNRSHTEEDWVKGVRKVEWRASHLKTFKYRVWVLVDHSYLKDKTGEYIKVTGDLALMYPILELSGKNRVQYIPEQIYTYNQETPFNDHKLRLREQMDMTDYIAGMAPYECVRDFNSI